MAPAHRWTDKDVLQARQWLQGQRADPPEGRTAEAVYKKFRNEMGHLIGRSIGDLPLRTRHELTKCLLVDASEADVCVGEKSRASIITDQVGRLVRGSWDDRGLCSRSDYAQKIRASLYAEYRHSR
ncbi:MAG: hypothetical protein AAF583_01510 [Pseudomonadota bacterium]